jgi:hypothetical protein
LILVETQSKCVISGFISGILKRRIFHAFRHRYCKKYLLSPPDGPTHHRRGGNRPEIIFDIGLFASTPYRVGHTCESVTRGKDYPCVGPNPKFPDRHPEPRWPAVGAQYHASGSSRRFLTLPKSNQSEQSLQDNTVPP